MRTRYLTQSGHRWRNYNLDAPEKLLVWNSDTDSVDLRVVQYWEAIGNFAVPYIRRKGKAIQLMDMGFAVQCSGTPCSEPYPQVWAENNELNRMLKYSICKPLRLGHLTVH